MTSTQLCIRIPEHELKILDRYAKQTKRTKTDIIREFIRSLDGTGLSDFEQQDASDPP
ncbi:ribbon-helix-helix protein, CopG family [Synechococcales cyanobacterium C]|uniref:Ribbon-helix-helix protein, CopG family n=1 Tax=Petrachloros mirabilis ULC683 TaxID=2781853 RepID=A0A8K1ZX15_9CYAN|nr:ribbon-helix-helix protein, CopG family [Petrachloros mirabilis]NCJ06825.1 ribbon-helix-helix protein, CopG family [Petrachloros mirabilis ULC683]